MALNGLQRVQLGFIGRCLKDPWAYLLEVSYSAEQGRPNKLKPQCLMTICP